MKHLIRAPLAASLILIASAGAVADSFTADQYRLNLVNNYRGLSNQPEWVNPYMPAGTGDTSNISIDEDIYTRTLAEAYDRVPQNSGWMNELAYGADGEINQTLSGEMLLSAIIQGYGSGQESSYADFDPYPAGATAAGN